MEVFPGHRQLNSMVDAKTRKLKTLRKESDKVRINLPSFFIRRAIGFCWARREKREYFGSGSGSVAIAGQQSTGWFRAGDAIRIRIEATPRRNPERTMGSNASCTQEAKEGNKSFIIKGRGSSVVEQPIRNRQAASSTLALGSNSKKTNEFLKPVTYR